MENNETREELVHVVGSIFGESPFAAAEDGLFDDCPLCQQLKRDIEAGQVVRVETDGGGNEWSGFRSF